MHNAFRDSTGDVGTFDRTISGACFPNGWYLPHFLIDKPNDGASGKAPQLDQLIYSIMPFQSLLAQTRAGTMTIGARFGRLIGC